MAHIAMLLNNDIRNDSRVINTIRSLSVYHNVDLFFLTDAPGDPLPEFSTSVELFPLKPKNGFRYRILRHTFFYLELNYFVPFVLQNGTTYDWIYANDLPCLTPAWKIAQRCGARLIYDSHEIYCETLNQFFPKNASWIKRLVFTSLLWFMKTVGSCQEKRLAMRADVFLTVSDGVKEYFETAYKIGSVLVVRNCPVLTDDSDTVDLLQMLNLPHNAFIAIYQGVFNEGRGLFLLIDAMKFVNPNIVLVLVGYGPLEAQLKKHAGLNGVNSRVFFPGKVDPSMLLSYTRSANCGINLLEPINQSKALAAPNKIYQYIHAEIPIVASYSYENNRLFEKYNLGILTENSPEKIAKALNILSATDRSVFISDIRRAKQEYHWENQVSYLINRLVEIDSRETKSSSL